MASIILRTDDITGETLPDGNPTTTVTLTDERESWTFEIDLSDDSFKGLVKALGKYSAKGRTVTPTSPNSEKDSAAAEEAKEARAWAIANRPDLNVSERGAVPKRAIVAYRAHLEGQTISSTTTDQK